jgi:hypothetical protein
MNTTRTKSLGQGVELREYEDGHEALVYQYDTDTVAAVVAFQCGGAWQVALAYSEPHISNSDCLKVNAEEQDYIEWKEEVLALWDAEDWAKVWKIANFPGGIPSLPRAFTVSNTFEIFGDPAPETFASRAEAETAANEMARGIATSCGFWQIDGDYAIIEVSDYPRGGNSNEIDFLKNLEEDSGAMEGEPGRITVSDLIARIRECAIEIEEVK